MKDKKKAILLIVEIDVLSRATVSEDVLPAILHQQCPPLLGHFHLLHPSDFQYPDLDGH
jgi:hypothetical protein